MLDKVFKAVGQIAVGVFVGTVAGNAVNKINLKPIKEKLAKKKES